MIYFDSDYSVGAHPEILKALARINSERNIGYGEDQHSVNAEEMIREITGKPDAHVHFLVGGTPANVITILSALEPYECALTTYEGHLFLHETGAAEAAGCKTIPLKSEDGKMRPEMIQPLLDNFLPEHMTVPKLVYISNATELSGVYTKAELEELSSYCRENDLYLFMDGARLGSALTAKDNDLTIKEIANLVDAFYVGGTKNGLLFGEAVVVLNDKIQSHYRYYLKQHLGMLAKGFVISTQFEALLKGGENSLFYSIGQYQNTLADKLRDGLNEMGVELFVTSSTNQVFPVFSNEIIAALRKKYVFNDWEKIDDSTRAIRFVTSWNTKESEIAELLKDIGILLEK